jgi:hypothetical protein
MGAAGVSVMLMNGFEFGGLVVMAGVVMGRMVVRRVVMSAVVMFGVIVGRGFVCRIAHRRVPKVLVAK